MKQEKYTYTYLTKFMKKKRYHKNGKKEKSSDSIKEKVQKENAAMREE